MEISAQPQDSIDPVKLLSAEFSSRSQKNPRYSLRAFAKSLGISHTVLSLVLSGKRPLSKKAAHLVADRMELSPEMASALVNVRHRVNKGPLPNFSQSYQKMDLDTFHYISDWIHYAILSLLEIKDFSPNPKWIAKRLGVNEMQAKIAFQRLIDLELVIENAGKWAQTGKSIKVENTISTSATRKFHRQLLEKALESLANDPIEVRDFSSMTLSIDPKQIPYAKERIRQFRRELTAELEAKGLPKEVYNLTVQIYPVSKGDIK